MHVTILAQTAKLAQLVQWLGYELVDTIYLFFVWEGIFSSCPERSCQVYSSPSFLFSDYHCMVRHGKFGCGAEVTNVPHLVPRFRVSGAKSLLPPCIFTACRRTTCAFKGTGRQGVDLLCYRFISNERILNVLFTATSRMSVKS